MMLLLVPEQAGKFTKFEQWLRDDLPACVWNNPSILKALEKWGMILAVEPASDGPPGKPVTPPERMAALRKAQQRNLSPSERRRILLRPLLWGTAPEIMVMGSGMWLGRGAHAAGTYDPDTDRITILKGLVEAWQADPDDDVLARSLTAVVLHELVHFYNDQVIPGTDLYAGETIHLTQFAFEAFAPLGWRPYQYTLDRDVLENRGVKP
jgi:hypothetical protein